MSPPMMKAHQRSHHKHGLQAHELPAEGASPSGPLPLRQRQLKDSSGAGTAQDGIWVACGLQRGLTD